MTKEQVDEYFNTNWNDIQSIIKSNAPKSKTKNVINISSDIYLICISKAATINNIRSFICLLAANTYRWEKSEHNKKNRILVESNEIPDTYTEDGCYIDVIENRTYALQKYYLNAETHEKRLFDLYVNQGVQTVKAIQERLNITYYAAQILLKEFKLKIREYEREIEIS